MAQVMKGSDASSPQKSGLSGFLALNSADHVDALSTEGQILFEFITLIIDIKYRNKYGKTLDVQHGKGYCLDVSDKAVAGQIPPVDDGLLRQ